MKSIRLTRCGDTRKVPNNGCGQWSNAKASDIGVLVDVTWNTYQMSDIYEGHRDMAANDGLCLNPHCRRAWSWLYFDDRYGHTEVLAIDRDYEQRRIMATGRIRTRSSAAMALFGTDGPVRG